MLAAQLANTVRLGFKSLTLHKLRAALTMLGIIFGVCSVIAMLAIGEGASYEAQEAIKKGVKKPGEAWMVVGRAEFGLGNKAGLV